MIGWVDQISNNYMIKEIDIVDIQNICWDINQLKVDRLIYLTNLFFQGIEIDPIEVRKSTKGYYLIDGSHRLNVYKKQGVLRVKAKVL